MIYKVIRGTARYGGAFFRKGSSFHAETIDADIIRLQSKGIIEPVAEPAAKKSRRSDEK